MTTIRVYTVLAVVGAFAYYGLVLMAPELPLYALRASFAQMGKPEWHGDMLFWTPAVGAIMATLLTSALSRLNSAKGLGQP